MVYTPLSQCPQDYLMGQDINSEVQTATLRSPVKISFIPLIKPGYLAAPLEEIVQSLENLSLEEAKEALEIVQALEPPGVGSQKLTGVFDIATGQT